MNLAWNAWGSKKQHISVHGQNQPSLAQNLEAPVYVMLASAGISAEASGWGGLPVPMRSWLGIGVLSNIGGISFLARIVGWVREKSMATRPKATKQAVSNYQQPSCDALGCLRFSRVIFTV